MKECHITTIKTARYYLSDDPSYKTKTVWLLLHGYAQSASEFIKIFDEFNGDDRLFVAPEALSRFYTKGFFGKIGASWMTKEDRENEIKDYLVYLNNLMQKILSEVNKEKIKVNVLGFSQGVATAFRVYAEQKFRVDKLILWAGTPPLDVDLKKTAVHSMSSEIQIFYGMTDRIIDKDKVLEVAEILKQNRVNFKLKEYPGDHEINSELLRKEKIFI